jgi:hypothetical protein
MAGHETQVHPAANLFPMMDERQYQVLLEDIRQHGVNDAVVYYHGQLLDGRNRMRACEELDITPYTIELEDEEDPWAWALSANLHRRHLTTSQKAMCAAKLPAMSEGKPTNDTVQNCTVFSAEQAAAMFTVSPRSVKHGRKVLAEGAAWLVALCEAGFSVATACKFIDAAGSKSEQTEAVKGADSKANAVREFLAGLKPAAVAEIVAVDLPDNPTPEQVAAAETWLERQDERPFVERLRALWNAAGELERSAMWVAMQALIDDRDD